MNSSRSRFMSLVAAISVLVFSGQGLGEDKKEDKKPWVGHEGAVISLAFTPNGKLLASGGHDGSARLWDAQTGKEVGAFYRDEAVRISPVFIALSPDGKTLAWSGAGKDDKRAIQLVDVATKKEAGSLEGDSPYLQLTISPDGKSLAVATAKGGIDLWDLAKQKRIKTLAGHKGRITGLSFSVDSKSLASSSALKDDDKNCLKVWDVATGEESTPFKDHRGSVSTVCFSPDGKTLASGDDSLVRIWDVKTGKVSASTRCDDVSGVAFSSDGKHLVYVQSKTGLGFNWYNNARLVALTDVDKDLDKRTFQAIVLQSVAVSPDGKRFAVGGGHFFTGDRTYLRVLDSDK